MGFGRAHPYFELMATPKGRCAPPSPNKASLLLFNPQILQISYCVDLLHLSEGVDILRISQKVLTPGEAVAKCAVGV